MDIDPSPVRRSPPSTPSSPMHLDLSGLPPLITPSPPSNTLLLTNLNSASTFLPANLSQIRDLLASHVPLHSFAPLKSLRRIILSLYTTDDAVALRRLLDGTDILGDRARCYFGVPTPIEVDEAKRHLQAPDAGRLFFISPPPSPPHGWTMRNEDPPNKAVHAEDLANALAKLRERPQELESDGWTAKDDVEDQGRLNHAGPGKTLVYHPENHGGNLSLPAVMVEDTEGGRPVVVGITDADGDEEMGMGDSPAQDGGRKITAHTARPPVELMDCS